MMQIMKKNLLVISKKTGGIWKVFITALGSLKIETLIGFFYAKQKMYKLKIYRGVLCRIIKRTDMRNLTNFDPSTRKPPKFEP